MMSFVIPSMPPLIKAVKPMVSTAGGNPSNVDIRETNPSRTVIVSLILAALYSIVMFTPSGDLIFSTAIYAETTFWVKTFLLMSSAVIVAFGMIAAIFIQKKASS